MPLAPNILYEEILKVTDATNPSFVGWPTVSIGGQVDVAASRILASSNWATAFERYLGQATLPPVTPAALSAFRGAFIVAGVVPTLEQAIIAGTAAFAAATPTALPPSGPLVLGLGAPQSDPRVVATTIASIVDPWMRTGLFGAPVPLPWS